MTEEIPFPQVALGIACNKNQTPNFWKSLFGLEWVGGPMMTSGGALTDTNRNAISNWFLLETEVDWLFFIDDDVEVPLDALKRLLATAHREKAAFVSGVYYMRRPPYEPLIYTAGEDGWYSSLRPGIDYQVGDVIDIDASGMGCTLIHRSVFHDILRNHYLYRRHNRSFGFMHLNTVETQDTDHLHAGVYIPPKKGAAYVVQEIQPMSPDQLAPNENLPFFALEYGRTEDFYFCEMAKASGVRMVADTGVECKHWGDMPVDRSSYMQAVDFMKQNGAININGNAVVLEELEAV